MGRRIHAPNPRAYDADYDNHRMMLRPVLVMPDASPRPTEAESAILAVLWARGPSTVRDVHEALPDRGTGYTTVLKLMQIMAHKGLLVRDESRRSHVYAPAIEQGRCSGGGSTSSSTAGSRARPRRWCCARCRASARRRRKQEIRELLDRLEREPEPEPRGDGA